MRFGNGRHNRTHGRGTSAFAVNRRNGCENAVVLEKRKYLCKHTPKSKSVCAVLNPAALVPKEVCKCRRKQKRKAAVPRMSRKIEVCILEIPYIISNNVNPHHIRPKHILFAFGGINAPPTGHAGNVNESRNSVEEVPPTAVKPNSFGGKPPAAGH